MSEGKILLVTGASSDMGMALIRRNANNYTKIVAHYRTMNDKLAGLMEVLGEKIVPVQADLSDVDEVSSMIEKIMEMNLVPDHIVHFPAPPCDNQKFHKIRWEVFQKEMDISLRSIVMILQAFLPKMAKKKHGRVILMLSYVVNNAAPAYCANYVVTKYAMLGLVKALATEYAPKGITVNGISPAWVKTKYIDNQPEMLVYQNEQNSPLKRNLEIDEVIPSVEFLLSDSACGINGENLSVAWGL